MAEKKAGDVGETDKLIAEFARRQDEELPSDLVLALREKVRRRIGEFLRAGGSEAAIDPSHIASDVAGRVGSTLSADRMKVLMAHLIRISDEELLDGDAHEVTRLLWMWNPLEDSSELEQRLFSAIEAALRENINRILYKSEFTGVRYKIDQAELVSALYLKLKQNGISFLPANRRQFLGLADAAIINILKDLQRTARAKMRPQSHLKEPLLDYHPDKRPDQLTTAMEVQERLWLENTLMALEPQEREIFKLRLSGVSIEEVAKMIGCSESTVKRDTRYAKQFLRNARKATDNLDS